MASDTTKTSFTKSKSTCRDTGTRESGEKSKFAKLPEMFKRMDASIQDPLDEHQPPKRPRDEPEEGNGLLLRILEEVQEARSEARIKFEQLEGKLSRMDEERKEEAKKVSSLEREVAELRKEIDTLRKSVLTREREDRKRNMIVKGIEETEREERGETKRKVMEMIRNEMKMECPPIVEARRIGPRTEGRGRIILTKFSCDIDKQEIIKNRGRLRGTNVYIEADLPPAIREKKRRLLRICREERGKGNKAFIVRDKINISGFLYELAIIDGRSELRRVEDETPKNDLADIE